MQIKNGIKVVFAISITTALALISGCSKKTATAPAAAPTVEVSVISIKTEQVKLTTELSGRTVPQMVAEVRPQVNGIIKERLFTEGADVKAGQALYKIDASIYQAAYSGAKANLAKASANLEAVKLKHERFKELVKINAVSSQDYDDINANLKLAEAELDSAKAALETARINLDYTKIKAPVSGRIGKSMVTTGALVTASQTAPLAVIQQLNPIYVDVTQSNSEMLKLKNTIDSGKLKASDRQTTVKLLLEDGTPYPFAGKFKFSDVTVDQSTNSVTLRTEFPNPKSSLLPGMYVRAILEEGIDNQAILVPQRAVTRNPKGEAMVMIVADGEKVEARVIKVIRTVGDSWLVSDGLKTGDRVILEGTQKGKPGTTVKAVPFSATPSPKSATSAAPPSAKH